MKGKKMTPISAMTAVVKPPKKKPPSRPRLRWMM